MSYSILHLTTSMTNVDNIMLESSFSNFCMKNRKRHTRAILRVMLLICRLYDVLNRFCESFGNLCKKKRSISYLDNCGNCGQSDRFSVEKGVD
uniref:Ovule protein n=1 Tax=Ascaris lumbricoides TaxID=6252 RepID=A0A0M3HWV2_ASCLU